MNITHTSYNYILLSYKQIKIKHKTQVLQLINIFYVYTHRHIVYPLYLSDLLKKGDKIKYLDAVK